MGVQRKDPINMKPRQYLPEIYYCTAFFVYSASFLAFFWELRSLFLRFSLSDILGFFSYQLAFALIESLVVAAAIFLLVLLLPIQQAKRNPSVVGGVFVFSFALSSFVFKQKSGLIDWLVSFLHLSPSSAIQVTMFLWLFAAFGLPVLFVLIARNEKFTGQIKRFIQNLSVLALLYTLLGLIGLFIVLYRNIL